MEQPEIERFKVWPTFRDREAVRARRRHARCRSYPTRQMVFPLETRRRDHHSAACVECIPGADRNGEAGPTDRSDQPARKARGNDRQPKPMPQKLVGADTTEASIHTPSCFAIVGAS